MLDTNICSFIMSEEPAAVLKRQEHAASYRDNTQAALADLLIRAGLITDPVSLLNSVLKFHAITDFFSRRNQEERMVIYN
ncbi:hypothetical protein [Enterobacter asburiae]|uniref:hypothetical protein n=1 Tax=Enterobacter TaxID=547 RepID=UPI003A0FBA0A